MARRLAAIVLLAAAAMTPACRRSERPPHVVLISVDTLRADRVGAYGYTARPTSPRIDALAEEALVFEVHIAAAPWTTPSHMSLLTGLTPTRHGVTGSDRGLREGLQGERPIERLPAAITTLAEALGAEGWATAAFTGGVTLDPRIGFDQGFEEYDTSMVKLDRGKVDRVLAWIDAHDDRPFFLFWHTFEVHAPYVAPEFLDEVLPAPRARALGERLESLPEKNGWKQVRAAKRVMRKHDAYDAEVTRALYDGGVRSFDRWLGELVDGLKERGLYERTLLVLTSDHGEQLGEAGRPGPYGDGFYNVHGNTLFEELIHVPLIVKLPGPSQEVRRIPEVTASIDVMPTILDVAGLPVPPEVQGRSLRPLWQGQAGWMARAALSESLSEGEEKKALRAGRYKYVVSIDAETVAEEGRSHLPPDPPAALYDLVEDPEERQDLLATAEEEATRRAGAMGQELRRRLAEVGEPEEAWLSPEAREGLEALGYVE